MGQKHTTASEFRRLFAAWIKHHAEVKQLNDDAIAEALGVSRPSFNKLKNGKRTAKFEEAAILSHLFSAELPTHLKLATQHPERKDVGLRQNVALDVWRRKESIMATSKLSVFYFSNEAFDNLEQFAHMVEDEHASGYVPKGFYIICVDYSDARKSPIHGDMVVVEQYRLFSPDEGGDLIEASIRRVAKKGNHWALESMGAGSNSRPDIPYNGDTPNLKIASLIIARFAPS